MSSAIGMGTNLIGSELQGWAAFIAKGEMNDQIDAEMARQAAYKEQGAEQFKQALGFAGSDFAKSELAKGEQQRNEGYAKVGQYQLGQKVGGQFGPTKEGEMYTASLGKNRAALGAYGDWATQQAIGQSKSQEGINLLTQRARGESSIFPYRLSSAQHSMDYLAAIGQLISSIGGSAANYMQMYSQMPNEYGGRGEAQSQDGGIDAWGQMLP